MATTAEYHVLLIIPRAKERQYFEQLLGAIKSCHIHIHRANTIKQAASLQSQPNITIDISLLQLTESQNSLKHYFKQCPDLPVIAVINQADDEREDALIHQGAQDVINQQSISSRGLNRVIRHATDRHHLSMALLHEQSLIQNIAQQPSEQNKTTHHHSPTRGHLLVQSNIDLLKKIHSKKNMLDYMAHHDVLTGLPNRLKLESELETVLKHSKRHQHQFAVLMLDLDGFKPVNDQHGHAAGDALLTAFAKRLQKKLRGRDLVARIGGDEFAIICTQIKNELSAGVIANKIIRSLDTAFTDIADTPVQIGASLGISNYPQDAKAGKKLLELADKAMYRAKNSGKNQYCFASTDLEQKHQLPNFFSPEFRQALRQRNVFLKYQPTISLHNTQLNSLEVLLQWQNTDLLMGPDEQFIPLTEYSSQLSQIGHWVFNSACKQFCQWQQQGRRDELKLSVSVEPFTLSNHQHCDAILKIIDVYRIPMHSVACHMNTKQESNNPYSAAVINRLNELGLHDTLRTLEQTALSKSKEQLHFISLKVDKRLLNKYQNLQVKDGIIELLVHFEPLPKTGSPKISLLPNHCYQIQGYYFAKPASDEEMDQYLEKIKQASL